jgi:hypothetical protein
LAFYGRLILLAEEYAPDQVEHLKDKSDYYKNLVLRTRGDSVTRHSGSEGEVDHWDEAKELNRASGRMRGGMDDDNPQPRAPRPPKKPRENPRAPVSLAKPIRATMVKKGEFWVVTFYKGGDKIEQYYRIKAEAEKAMNDHNATLETDAEDPTGHGTAYLRQARAKAKAYGLDPKKLKLGEGKHKLSYDGIGFGLKNYKDFLLWSAEEKAGRVPKGTAEKKRKLYLARATKIKGDWKENKVSPNNLAIHILW